MLKLLLACLSFFLVGSTLCMEEEKFSKKKPSSKETYESFKNYLHASKSPWSSIEECQRFNLNFSTAAIASKARLKLEKKRINAHEWKKIRSNNFMHRYEFEETLTDTLDFVTASNIKEKLTHQAHGDLDEYDNLLADESDKLSNCVLGYIAYKDLEENNK